MARSNYDALGAGKPLRMRAALRGRRVSLTDPMGVATIDSSAGAILVVKPFNFGRDPGGPEDKTLYLSVPKLGLTNVPVFDSLSKEELKESAVHIPATGFPWQKGANTYIAGHRLGYEGTGSYLIFYYLDQLTKGDEIILRDSASGTYRYRVIKQEVVGPDNVEVMDTVEGKSVVSLQTCTLPDYKERLIVRGELVEKEAARSSSGVPVTICMGYIKLQLAAVTPSRPTAASSPTDPLPPDPRPSCLQRGGSCLCPSSLPLCRLGRDLEIPPCGCRAW